MYVTQSIMITNTFLCLKTLFSILIVFHTLACCWIYLGAASGGWRELLLFEHQKNNVGAIYVYAFYFVSTTATTIGYGDITGQLYNDFEPPTVSEKYPEHTAIQFRSKMHRAGDKAGGRK